MPLYEVYTCTRMYVHSMVYLPTHTDIMYTAVSHEWISCHELLPTVRMMVVLYDRWSLIMRIVIITSAQNTADCFEHKYLILQCVCVRVCVCVHACVSARVCV